MATWVLNNIHHHQMNEFISAIISKILWSKLFIEAQGFEVKANNIVYQLHMIGREW
jgi:hypothetical protein